MLTNVDKQGLWFTMDLDGRINHLFTVFDGVGCETNLSFENCLKNINNPDPWGSFHVKEYNNLGMFNGEYNYIVNKDILMETPEFVAICKILAPEYMIAFIFINIMIFSFTGIIIPVT